MAIAHVDIVTATTTTIFTPATGRRFRVTGFHLVAAGTQTVKWQRGSTDMGDAWSFVTGVPHTFSQNPFDASAVFEGQADEALKLVTTAAVQLSGFIVYDHI